MGCGERRKRPSHSLFFYVRDSCLSSVKIGFRLGKFADLRMESEHLSGYALYLYPLHISLARSAAGKNAANQIISRLIGNSSTALYQAGIQIE